MLHSCLPLKTILTKVLFYAIYMCLIVTIGCNMSPFLEMMVQLSRFLKERKNVTWTRLKVRLFSITLPN